MLGRKARELGCTLIAGGCAPDHVHLIVRLAPMACLANLVRHMKGASAHELNHDPRTSPFQWQRHYWAESIAPADLAPVTSYVRGQRQHHDPQHPSELWLSGPDT